jgi:hypothetical protein
MCVPGERVPVSTALTSIVGQRYPRAGEVWQTCGRVGGKIMRRERVPGERESADVLGCLLLILLQPTPAHGQNSGSSLKACRRVTQGLPLASAQVCSVWEFVCIACTRRMSGLCRGDDEVWSRA